MPEYDVNGNVINISEEVEKIRKAQLGIEVRESIANGIEKVSEYVKGKFTSVQPLAEIEESLNAQAESILTQASEVNALKTQAQNLVASAQSYDERITQAETDINEIQSLDSGWIALPYDHNAAEVQGAGSLKQTAQYRKIGNHVFIRGRLGALLNFQESGYPLKIADLPSEIVPGNMEYFFQPCEGKRIARLFVNETGELKIDWIANFSDGTVYTTNGQAAKYTWFQIKIDYFLD